MAPVIVFDVNETLLDLEPIRDHFSRIFGDRSAAGVWFSQLLKLSFVAAVTDNYHPFTELGGAALDMIAQARGQTFDAADRQAIVTTLRSLPPHSDSEAGLARLSAAGFRLAALTNSPQAVAEEQLGGAGLDGYMERIMSVEMESTFKPAARVYQAAARELGVATTDMVMVAAHDWDVAGAMAAGCKGAFVARPGMVLSPLQPPPDIVGSDISDVAEQIVDRYS